MWVLIVFSMYYTPGQQLTIEHFETRENCRIAGTRIYEFTKHEASWSCLKK